MDYYRIRNLIHSLASTRQDTGEPMPLSKLAMPLNANEKNSDERPLQWQRYHPGANVPSLMRHEIDTQVSSFRMTFSPFSYGAQTPAVTQLLDMIHAGPGGLVFAWYADDQHVSDDDLQRLATDADPRFGRDPQQQMETKAKAKKLADFCQRKGVKILPPGSSNDPSDDRYENLSDRHLSFYGYAFRGIDGITVHEGAASAPAQARPFKLDAPRRYVQQENERRKLKGQPPISINTTGKDALWGWADLWSKVKPDSFKDRIAQVEVMKNSQGNYALFFVYKRLNQSGAIESYRKQPVLGMKANVDHTNPDDYKEYFKKYMKGELVPFNSFLWMPEGPTGPVKMVSGIDRQLDTLGKQLEKSDAHRKLYEDEDAPADALDIERYRTKSMLMTEQDQVDASGNVIKKSRADQVYKVIFDGPEGGLLVQNVKDPSKVHPLNEQQVRQLVNWGEKTDGSFHEPHEPDFFHRLWTVYPPRQARDSWGRPKPVMYGKWEISDEDKAKLRQDLKPIFEVLTTSLQKYHRQREEDRLKAEGKDLTREKIAERGTATQGVRWAIIGPRYENPEVKKLLAKMVRSKKPVNTAEPVTDDMAVQAESFEFLKKLAAGDMNADPYASTAFDAVSEWVVLGHNLNIAQVMETGERNGMHETPSGNSKEAYATIDGAIKSALNHYGISPNLQPDAGEIQTAQKVWEAAVTELKAKKIKPNVSNPATLKELAHRGALSMNKELDRTQSGEPEQHPTAGVTAQDFGSLFGNVSQTPSAGAPPAAAAPAPKPKAAPAAPAPVEPVKLNIPQAPGVAPAAPKPAAPKPVAPVVPPPAAPVKIDIPSAPKRKPKANPAQMSLFGEAEGQKKTASQDFGDSLLNRIRNKYGL